MTALAFGTAPVAKGGRLEARVVNFSPTNFTVKISGKGHELHEKEATLPIELWRGPGGVIGAPDAVPFDKDDPRARPRPNDFVYYDADLLEALSKPAAKDPLEAIEAAKSAALSAIASAAADAIAKVQAASAPKS